MIGCTQPTMVENQTYDFAAESSTKPLQAYFSEIIFDGELFIHTIYPAYCLTKDYTSDRFLFEPVWCYEGEVLYPHERRDSIHVFLSAERKATRNDSHTTLWIQTCKISSTSGFPVHSRLPADGYHCRLAMVVWIQALECILFLLSRSSIRRLVWASLCQHVLCLSLIHI